MISRSPEEIETIVAGNMAAHLAEPADPSAGFCARVQAEVARLAGQDRHAEITDFERPFFAKIGEADHA